MGDFSHGLGGWNILFTLILFGGTVLFGLHAIHTSLEITVQAISARATADLTRAQAELEGLCHRMESLEEQLTLINERVSRCEENIQLLVVGMRNS